MKKFLPLLLCACMAFSLAGCGESRQQSDYTPISGLNTEEKAALTIGIPYETNKALNTVANAFMSSYPNINVQLQYVEDYDKNAVQLMKDNKLDIILQKGITYEVNSETGKSTDDYFYDFAADEEIDFTGTTSDITDNYRSTRIDETGSEVSYLYSYPLGGETRGVFVNKTLLDAYGLAIPTNYTELLNCCETLKQAGLIPIQGGGDTAAYSLGLAPAANAVVHDEAALARMAAAEPGVSEEFRSTVEKIYTLATKRYFDYKAVEESGFFTTTNELGQAQSFLGLKIDDGTFEVTKPENNYGYAAFLPYISSAETVIRNLIDEYELDTELAFICSPLNDEGTNSPAYITPYYGVCINKNSAQLIWAREFVNFLFQPEMIKTYAEEAAIIPNTTDALQVAAGMYGLNPDTDVTVCGQIRFSDDYNGFTPLAAALKDTIKCSAQKYMVDLNPDANGNVQYQTGDDGAQFLLLGNGETKVTPEYVGEPDAAKPGYAFCTLEYFMNGLENNFAKYRVG